jgi:hypothetical protein
VGLDVPIVRSLSGLIWILSIAGSNCQGERQEFRGICHYGRRLLGHSRRFQGKAGLFFILQEVNHICKRFSSPMVMATQTENIQYCFAVASNCFCGTSSAKVSAGGRVTVFICTLSGQIEFIQAFSLLISISGVVTPARLQVVIVEFICQ